jgi:predicted DNA-binding transcriptional regulator AlpA
MLRARQAKSNDIAELDAIVADLRALLRSPTVERIASRLVDVLRRSAMGHMTYRLLTLQEAIALLGLTKSVIYTTVNAGVVHRYRLPNGRRTLYHEHELGIVADVYRLSGVRGVRRLIASAS